MKILYASAEAAPFFKTGGLGDVAYALPKELATYENIDIRVVLPYYTQLIPQNFKDKIQEIHHFRFQMGLKDVYCGIKFLELDKVKYYFIDNLEFFDRPNLYGYWDDGGRFGYFSLAIIEMLEVIDWIPDIIHVNDWQTAMIPALLVDRYHWKEKLQSIRKVLTIHNIAFQGIYDSNILTDVFGTGFNIFTEDGVKQSHLVNYLKGGINFSDRVTTVSPSYAQEIMTQEFGEGLEGTLRYNDWKVYGIINGIDYTLNNPATDSKIPFQFDMEDLSGKINNKEALQKHLGLPINTRIPVIGMVSRLTNQKGFQLVESILDELLQDDVQVILLGTGDPSLENTFKYFADKYPSKMRSLIMFDTDLAQLIYAASDIFLMPSAFEPCGLSQMIAMRYGTIPIVHETGGLKDTVIPFNEYTNEGTGFSFEHFYSGTFLDIIRYALWIYREHPEKWIHLMKNAMAQDFRWQGPAEKYLELYVELLEG